MLKKRKRRQMNLLKLWVEKVWMLRKSKILLRNKKMKL